MQQELESAFQSALDHLAMLAKNDGWKQHAWHRAKELDKQEHGMYRGIKEALVERMKQDKEEAA